jgi:protein-arginine kinase activator protein McsA
VDTEDEDALQEVTQIMEPLTSSEDMLDNLNEALGRAVEEEEYEVAARLRDRIKEIEKRIQN